MNTQTAEPIDGVSKLGTINPGVEPQATHTPTNGSTAALKISSTAQQSGYGSDRYKRVTFMTTEERAMVRTGTRVFLRADRISARGPKGTKWRVAVRCENGFYPRVPTPEEIASLRASTGLV
ncbi:hypothetical protein [Polaromonas sp. C04]|uniref:hypothetical protein n=1 Tax=Polaromonas sp. C04 TaxID=1945857 RepID=UPI001185F288|nr:hypothetical protein [Polaromonas sp. C04]